MSKKRLGRGLGDILGEVTQVYEKEVPQKDIVEIPIENIRKNPYQPRKEFDPKSLQELADSIKEHGLLQPIVVIEDIDGYILIAGERRLRASKLAGFTKIKAIIANIDKRRFREYALIENIQRENLKPLELAYSYKELLEEHGITHDELAKIVKKSRVHITNTLRLLQLSEYTKEALKRQKISAGHAKVLVGLDEESQKKVVDTIIEQNLSVRQTEKLVQKRGVTKSDSTKERAYDFSQLIKKLQDRGFKVKAMKQSLTIHFQSQEDIDKFLEIFS